jgi:CRP-like cAMP-binding protein
LAGEAEVFVEGAEGPIRVALLERNALVGEIAILCDVPRTATVRAVTDLDTLRITKERFLQLLEEFPKMGQEIMRALALRLEATTAQLTAARAQLRAAGLDEA